ncbi:tyrosine-type recombinase/integrase [Anaerobium acetethylicum]|uniref:Site-specific recombinase XerD n=1 Tax=Anaerobium acetethylicum TaxID=1619234 RepID=A0A1D3TXQ5_9FIRM|nr:site-specific integrase [Anaerobium acetethylicum]SCP99167.1 Site-specific recombinase XerD [Anaerobium acetethylicum]
MAKREKKLPRYSYGTGSMSRTKSGKIMYKKWVGEGDNKIRLTTYGETDEEALEKMQLKEKEHCTGIEKAKKQNISFTLGDSIGEWMSLYKYNTIRNSSYDREEATLKNQIQGYGIAKLQVQAVKDKDIIGHLQKLNCEGYSYSTIKKTYEIFKQYFDHVYKNDPAKNPMRNVKMIGKENVNTEEKVVEAFDEEEINKLIDAAMSRHGNGEYVYYHGLGIIFLMFIFARVGEGLALQWKDIDFEGKTVNVSETVARCLDRSGNASVKYTMETHKPKTKNGTRVVSMSEDACKIAVLLKNQKKPPSDEEYVFATREGTVAIYRNLYRAFNSITKKAGINKKCGLHTLRHTGITLYINQGVKLEPLSKMAGHSSIQITADIYYNLTDTAKKEITAKMNSKSFIAR